jgi:hypothetical protein
VCLSPYLAYIVPVTPLIVVFLTLSGLYDTVQKVLVHRNLTYYPPQCSSSRPVTLLPVLRPVFGCFVPKLILVTSFASVHWHVLTVPISLLLSFSRTCSVKQINSTLVQDKQKVRSLPAYVYSRYSRRQYRRLIMLSGYDSEIREIRNLRT